MRFLPAKAVFENRGTERVQNGASAHLSCVDAHIDPDPNVLVVLERRVDAGIQGSRYVSIRLGSKNRRFAQVVGQNGLEVQRTDCGAGD